MRTPSVSRVGSLLMDDVRTGAKQGAAAASLVKARTLVTQRLGIEVPEEAAPLVDGLVVPATLRTVADMVAADRPGLANKLHRLASSGTRHAAATGAFATVEQVLDELETLVSGLLGDDDQA